MSAYYNENDRFAAQWLRNLIAAGHIAPGEVDERSITEVHPDDLRGFDQCHAFAGIGGWSYALRLAGWPDDRPVWTGSCPCQPFSAAGKGAEFADERHLWPAWFWLIRERRPGVIFGEQVASATALAWFDHVATDLEIAGYAVAAADLCAASAGAFHIRQRVWFVADADGGHASAEGLQPSGKFGLLAPGGGSGDMADAQSGRLGSGSGDERGQEGAGGAHAHDAERCRGLGNPDRTGLQGGQRGDLPGARRRSEGGLFVQPGGQRGALGEPPGSGCQRIGDQPAHSKFVQASPWADPEWIRCRDGKDRPTQPGLFPLVTRLPGGLVRSGDPSASNNSPEARVGRLRGYGNAIVPQVAAQFIRACMEVMP